MSLANHLFEHPWKSAKEKGTEAPSSAEKVPWLKWANKSCSHRSSTMEVEKSEAPATPEFPNRVIFHFHYGPLRQRSEVFLLWTLCISATDRCQFRIWMWGRSCGTSWTKQSRRGNSEKSPWVAGVETISRSCAGWGTCKQLPAAEAKGLKAELVWSFLRSLLYKAGKLLWWSNLQRTCQ